MNIILIPKLSSLTEKLHRINSENYETFKRVVMAKEGLRLKSTIEQLIPLLENRNPGERFLVNLLCRDFYELNERVMTKDDLLVLRKKFDLSYFSENNESLKECERLQINIDILIFDISNKYFDKIDLFRDAVCDAYSSLKNTILKNQVLEQGV